VFSYIGGKSVHSKWLDPLFPDDFSTYVEVFGGAFWMYWMSKKTPATTNIYNDFNRHLVNVFTCASTDPGHFHSVLLSYYPWINDEDKYNEFRTEIFGDFERAFNIPDYDLAAKYMFLQTHHFSGGTGLGPTTKIYKELKYKPKFITFTEKFTQRKYLEKLDVMSCENMDCRDLIRKYDHKDTFFYIDPPYFKMEDYYTKNSFGYNDHIELIELMKQTKGRWALSYYYFDELEQLLPRDQYVWHEEKTISVNGLSKSDGATTKNGKPAKGVRTSRTEIVVMNYHKENSFDNLFEI